MPRADGHNKFKQSGAALLLVLWTALLLSVIMAGALANARIEARIAAVRQQQLEAGQALRAGLDLAAWKIAAGDGEESDPLVSDFQLNAFTVTVVTSIEGEKLDLNRAGEQTFFQFFTTVGLEIDDANRLAAEIADWRDADNFPRPNGAEKSDYVLAKNKAIGDRPFNSVSELNDVLHMTPKLYGCIAPALTIFGSGAAPTARVMALIGAQPILDEPLSRRTILGTSARGATAGGVHVIEATAVKKDALLAPQRLTRVFRVSGKASAPFDQIAELTPVSDVKNTCRF